MASGAERRFADALIKTNKDFDLLMICKRQPRPWSGVDYVMRRGWDYFVKWLLRVEPPTGVDLSTPPPPGG